jgi:hypothetical protein
MRESFENRLIVCELSEFLLTVANFGEGIVAPMELNVAFVISGREFGLISQAGTFISVLSMIK